MQELSIRRTPFEETLRKLSPKRKATSLVSFLFVFSMGSCYLKTIVRGFSVTLSNYSGVTLKTVAPSPFFIAVRKKKHEIASLKILLGTPKTENDNRYQGPLQKN